MLYAVERIVDGDTVVLSELGTVRLIGIDTPESVDPRKPVECFALEATAKMKSLLEGGKVEIEFDPTQDQTDRYGRALVYLFREDGLFVNKEMIAEGYAYEYTYNSPYLYQQDFKSAQSAAQIAQKGLWSPQACP